MSAAADPICEWMMFDTPMGAEEISIASGVSITEVRRQLRKMVLAGTALRIEGRHMWTLCAD